MSENIALARHEDLLHPSHRAAAVGCRQPKAATFEGGLCRRLPKAAAEGARRRRPPLAATAGRRFHSEKHRLELTEPWRAGEG